MRSNSTLIGMLRRWQLYMLLLPSVLYILLFHYVPMYGVVIAFKDFKSSLGILGSSWAGMKHFSAFFKLRRIWHVDLPSIRPTIMILFILGIGSIMSVGWEKAFLMQQGMNLPASEIISTYVYKVGLLNAQYSFATAIGLFNSVINFTLLILTNYLSRKLSGNSLW